MQGTSIEDIEMGNVKNEADSEAMRQILTDMNVTDESTNRQQPQMQMQMPMPMASPEYSTNMASMPQQPQMTRQRQPFSQHYPPRMQIHEYDEEPEEPTSTPKYKKVKPIMKKNKWSELFETLKEPLFIGILVTLLLIPKVHTVGSKYAPWAYTIGGQLGWIGIAICAVLAMSVWSVYKFFTN